jgi:hypothetical protein
MRRPNCGVSSVALVLLLSAPAVRAQAVSGTILGTVQDSSGAAVPGASVTIVNSETGLTRSVTTDSAGEYNVPSLPPGMYNLSSGMKGFKKVSIAGVRLNVDQKARVDLKLDVGDIAESVQVQAAIPLVQTDSSELGVTVNETQVKELPLNGRDFVQLTRLIPGVSRGVPGSNNDALRAAASAAAPTALSFGDDFKNEQKTPCLRTARTYAILTAPAAGWFSNVR